MNNHDIYAIILNEEIINLIVAENIFQATECAKTYDSERAIAVECGDYKCSIGDCYIDGIFYFKDRETLIPNTSVNTLIETLTYSNEMLERHLNDITHKYETIEQSLMTVLQNNVDIEMALCELAQLIENKEEA